MGRADLMASNPAGDWLENPFNQVVVADFAACSECDAAAGQACVDVSVVGTCAHTARVAAGMDVLSRELIARRGA